MSRVIRDHFDFALLHSLSSSGTGATCELFGICGPVEAVRIRLFHCVQSPYDWTTGKLYAILGIRAGESKGL